MRSYHFSYYNDFYFSFIYEKIMSFNTDLLNGLIPTDVVIRYDCHSRKADCKDMNTWRAIIIQNNHPLVIMILW